MRRLVSACARWWDLALVVALTLGAYLWLTGPAWAMTVGATATELTVSYEEPTTLEDGSPLDDLASTTVWVQRGTQAPEVCATVPATAPTGGGAVTTPCTVPNRAVYVIWATATRAGYPEPSDPSAPVTVRLLRPAPPQ